MSNLSSRDNQASLFKQSSELPDPHLIQYVKVSYVSDYPKPCGYLSETDKTPRSELVEAEDNQQNYDYFPQTSYTVHLDITTRKQNYSFDPVPYFLMIRIV